MSDIRLHHVTLELSAKAFRDSSDETMARVCRTMFEQWKPLTENASEAAVLLWLSDGSEILEFDGDWERSFEWAHWIGVANHLPPEPDMTERRRMNTHFCPIDRMPEDGVRTYGWVKKLCAMLKKIGGSVTGLPVRVGATFDCGPEFAISDFKYRRHREIMQGHSLYPHSFLTCNTVLHADAKPYAGYPAGIPEGTPFGEFLGRQFRHYAAEMGFDYLWLSNGIGFGTETWGITGMLFDKKAFHPEKAAEASESMLMFWRSFMAEMGGIPVETRGSNFSAGVEIATDAAPLEECYETYRIAPPVNSPWAALNYNTGLELAAWMSHVAVLPDGRFPFRYYIQDPWFYVSPWFDCYGREAWDIYQPLSIGRIGEAGELQTPNSLALLSTDNSYGEMPESVAREVIPILQDAFRTAPDEAAPLVWVYPFREYSRMVRGAEPRPDQVFNEDMFLGEMIQQGMPLNTVVDSRIFRKLVAEKTPRFAGKILVIPVSAWEESASAIRLAAASGAKILLYGSLQYAAPELLKFLGMARAEKALTGVVAVDAKIPGDIYEEGGVCPTIAVLPQFDAGGLREISDGAETLAAAIQGGERRVIAARNGGVVFLRSLLPCSRNLTPSRDFDELGTDRSYPVSALGRLLLSCFGWRFRASLFSAETMLPRVNLARHDNAFYFNAFLRDTSADVLCSTPFGAPVSTEREVRLKNGESVLRFGKSCHSECRVFVKQAADSVICCKIRGPIYPAFGGRLDVSGLRNAEVRIFPPKGARRIDAIHSEGYSWDVLLDPIPVEYEETDCGFCAVVKNISEHVLLAW